jgi:hypothetical protein
MVASSVLGTANNPASVTSYPDTHQESASPPWIDSLSEGLGLSTASSTAIRAETFFPPARYHDQASLGLLIQPVVANPATPAALAAIGSALLFGFFRQTTRNSGASFSPKPSIDSSSLTWSSPLPVTALRGPLTLPTIMSSLGELKPAVAAALRTELLRLQRQSPNPNAFFSALPTSPAVLAQAFALATLKAARLPATPAAQNAMIAQMSVLANNSNTFANNLIQFSNGFATTSTRQHQFASGVFNSEMRRFMRELGLVDSKIAQKFRTILTQRAREGAVQPYQYLAHVVSSGTNALNNTSSALFTALATATAQAYGLSLQKVAAFMRQQASPEQMVASLNALAASPQVRASLRAEEPVSGSVMEARRRGMADDSRARARARARARYKQGISGRVSGEGPVARYPLSPNGSGKPPRSDKDRFPAGGDGVGQNGGFRETGTDGNLTLRPGDTTPPPAPPTFTSPTPWLNQLGDHFLKIPGLNKFVPDGRMKTIAKYAAGAAGLGWAGTQIFSLFANAPAPDKIAKASSSALTLTPLEFRPQIDSNGNLVMPKLLNPLDIYTAALDEDLKNGRINRQDYDRLLSDFQNKITNPTSNIVTFDKETWGKLYAGADLTYKKQQATAPIAGMTLQELGTRHPEFLRGRRDELLMAMKRYWLNQAYLVGMRMDRATQENIDVAVDMTKAKIYQQFVSVGFQTVSANDLTHASFWGRTQPAGVQNAQVWNQYSIDMENMRQAIADADADDIEKTVAAVKTQYEAAGGARTASASQRSAYINELGSAINKMNGLVAKLEKWKSTRALAEARKYQNELLRERQLVTDRSEGLVKQGQALATQIEQLSTQQASVRIGVASLVSNAVRNLNEEANNNGLGLTNEGVILPGGAKLRAPVRDEGETPEGYRKRIRSHCQNAGRAIAEALQTSENASINGMRNEASIAKYLEDRMVAITDGLEKRAAGTDLLEGGSQGQEDPPPTTRRPNLIRRPANGVGVEQDTLIIPTPANPATPGAGGLMP